MVHMVVLLWRKGNSRVPKTPSSDCICGSSRTSKRRVIGSERSATEISSMYPLVSVGGGYGTSPNEKVFNVGD